MNAEQTSPTPLRYLLGSVLAFVFAITLLMGPGPGLAYANTPELVLGMPSLYAWGLLWYVVQVAVVLLAFAFVWKKEDDEED
ncbi:MAG: hypothetical protein N2C14_33495 [Planctomycetales bacterium]